MPTVLFFPVSSFSLFSTLSIPPPRILVINQSYQSFPFIYRSYTSNPREEEDSSSSLLLLLLSLSLSSSPRFAYQEYPVYTVYTHKDALTNNVTNKLIINNDRIGPLDKLSNDKLIIKINLIHTTRPSSPKQLHAHLSLDLIILSHNNINNNIIILP
jgi:hypothetical protein